MGSIGFVRIASFGDESIVPDFDRALEALRDTAGIVIDVRENGGGDTAYARPIMGRFVREKRRYAWMARRAPGSDALGPRWEEFVEPRGPFTYDGPVVVLVDRFSASMAEGFPMGMRGIGRAKIVGTPMAGLGAAIESFDLPRSGLTVQISAEPVYDAEGRPRWKLIPDVVVTLDGSPSAANDDAILAAGLAALVTTGASSVR
jgi:carboxyl-terminal processing protease